MKKIRVLFVCTHNSARSQMAEAFLNHLAGDRFEALSAGFEPAALNPLGVEVMREVGIDISKNKPKSVWDLYRRGELFRYVITVCDAKTAEQCPIFPGVATTLNWSFDDPALFMGSYEEKLGKMRHLRDSIRARVEAFIAENK